MFCLNNKKNDFQLCTLILRPDSVSETARKKDYTLGLEVLLLLWSLLEVMRDIAYSNVSHEQTLLF